jgi:hypothetical protein
MKTRAQYKQEQLRIQSEMEETREIAQILLSLKQVPEPPVPPLNVPISVWTDTEIEVQLPKPTYEVDIDFDGASREWRRNKIKKSDGTYQYRCIAITTVGKQCVLAAMKEKRCCYIHRLSLK